LPCPPHMAFPCPAQPSQPHRGTELSCSCYLDFFFFNTNLKIKKGEINSRQQQECRLGWAELCSSPKQKPCPAELLLSPQEGQSRGAVSAPLLETLKAASGTLPPAAGAGTYPEPPGRKGFPLDVRV